MREKSIADIAAAHAARLHNLEEPLIVDHAEARDPESGKTVHRVRVVGRANPNGPAYSVTVDERGEPVAHTPAVDRLFDRSILTAFAGALAALPGITIQPDTNVLTLNPGDTIDEVITVTVPKSAGAAKADVYFLADTTGSMSAILTAVQTGANNVLSALAALGIDLAFGVGNYRDFASGDPYAFQHQLSPTNAPVTVTAAINAWTASGGGDLPEANLFALDSIAVVPGGTIGWRTGSKRIVVWFGDAAGHDPICTAVSGQPAAITEASVTAKLVAEGIVVLAISTATPGLDDVPAPGYPACGTGGAAGQATRIATATGGKFVTGINASNIVNTIIDLVKGAVGSINNVKLVPSPSVAPFVVSISPAAGYGPLSAGDDHVLTFHVRFAGVPCKATAQDVGGTIDVVADDRVVARKRVQITVPPCAFVYSVKFVCGVQPACDCECSPVRPGTYATEINIHNYSRTRVEVVKRVVPVVLASAPIGREPRVSGVRAEDKIVLPPASATMDDCCRMTELLFGGDAPSPVPLTIGFLELTASAEIAVTAVYTASDLKSGGVSATVVQIAGRRL